MVSQDSAMLGKDPAVLKEYRLDPCKTFRVNSLQLSDLLICLSHLGEKRCLILNEGCLGLNQGPHRLFQLPIAFAFRSRHRLLLQSGRFYFERHERNCRERS